MIRKTNNFHTYFAYQRKQYIKTIFKSSLDNTFFKHINHLSFIYILFKHETAMNTNDISWIPFPIGNNSFIDSFFYIIHKSIILNSNSISNLFILSKSKSLPRRNQIYIQHSDHFLFPTALTTGFS